MPESDQPLRYRSLDGHLCNARLVADEGAGLVTVEVLIAGSSSTLRRSHIPLLAQDNGLRAICFPAAA